MALNKVNYVNDQTIITAQNLNNIQNEIIKNAELIKKVAPRNLLDNSDFTNPVNQRNGYYAVSGATYYSNTGLTTAVSTLTANTTATYVNTTYGTVTINSTTYYVSYADMVKGYVGSGYTIDRWRMTNANTTLSINNESITLTNTVADSSGYLLQILENPSKYLGKTLTLAAESNNKLFCVSVVLPTAFPTANTLYAVLYDDGKTIGSILLGENNVWIRVWSNADEDSRTFKWIALYEGEYTAETLPEYQPKGYGAELAECLYYFERIKANNSGYYLFSAMTIESEDTARGSINYGKKRITPTITINGSFRLRGATAIEVSEFAFGQYGSTGATIEATISGGTAGQSAVLQANNDKTTYIDISADL